jgi:putative acetyltransferase
MNFPLGPGYIISSVDPLGRDALALLEQAAIEARRLYADLTEASAPMPTNTPLQSRSAYLIAYDRGRPLGCGAFRPLDAGAAELRRMYVIQAERRKGVAQALLAELEIAARRLDYTTLRLETGVRQRPAMMFYEANGFHRILPFAPHEADPTSVCYEKRL